MNKTDRANFLAWANRLTPEQMRPLLIEAVERLVETQDVFMGDLSPYWEPSGEPLVPDQEVWREEG